MAYEIKNNEIAWAPAVENINRGFRVFGVSAESSFKVLPFEDMVINIPNGGQCWINDIRQTWIDHIQDDFEGGINDWKFDADTTLSEENSIVFEGTKSLKMVWNHDGSSQFQNRIYKEYDSTDIKYRNKLILQFYPEVALENDLYIKYKNNNSEFILTQIPAASLTPGQWNRILVDLPSNDVQKNKFQALIFEFDGLQWSSGTHTFYFDIVEFDTQVDVPTADPNDERKDLVVVGEDGKIELIEGTPQSQNPVEPPDLPADKHALAIITVPAGLTTITATHLFDTRVPNSFAVNADKTKNELTTIKGEIVQLALTDIEQNALLRLPSDIPFSNMVVEKFWDRDGLNDTIEVIDVGENMHGFFEAIDFPRGQVNVSGLPDISGMGGTGWGEATWRTRAYYWRGKIWTWMHSTSKYNEIGWGIASLNPETGAKIFANIWTDDWQADNNDNNPTGSRTYSFYKHSSTTYCAQPKDWTHDEDYLYIPVYMSAMRIGYYTTAHGILKIDEDGNEIEFIHAESVNGSYKNWYSVYNLHYDVNLKAFLVMHSGQKYYDWSHQYCVAMYDKSWREIFTGNFMSTSRYPYGFFYIPESGYLYQAYWRHEGSHYKVAMYRWRVTELPNGQKEITYNTHVESSSINSNINGYPRYWNAACISNQKDRAWIVFRDAEYNIRCIYVEAGTNDDWWENYNIGDNVLARGILVEANVEAAETSGIPYQGWAVDHASDTCFYSYGDKTYKLEGGKSTPGECVAAGSFSGRRGVSQVGKSSITFWDTTNDAFYIADYANSLTGREQIGFDWKTKTLNFENVKGLYITAKVAGRGTTALLASMKVDVLDGSGTPITGLTDLDLDEYHPIPLAAQQLDQFKLRFHYTPDGLNNIMAQFHEYGIFVDNEVA